jgi:hypothetical protein
MMSKISNILGSISPVYGMISGKGLFGKLLGGGGSDAKDEIEERRQRTGKKLLEEAEADKKESSLPAYAKAAISSGGEGMKRGGRVKSKVSSASKRADGIAQRGKTRGKFV